MLPSQEVGSGKPLGLPLFLWKAVGGAGLKSRRLRDKSGGGFVFYPAHLLALAGAHVCEITGKEE